jgi:hypothetical protein
LSIEEISRTTCITTGDIIETLKFAGILVWYKGKWTFSTTRLTEVSRRLEEKEAANRERLRQNPEQINVEICKQSNLHWYPFFANKRSGRSAGGKGGKGGPVTEGDEEQ